MALLSAFTACNTIVAGCARYTECLSASRRQLLPTSFTFKCHRSLCYRSDTHASYQSAVCVSESCGLHSSHYNCLVLSLCLYIYVHTYVHLQPAVIQVSPVYDADSDDEWNMLGRRVTDKEQHLPNQDGPARVHTMQVVSENGPVCVL